MGWVISTEWYSKVEGDRLVRGNTENVQEGEISKPLPLPRPGGRAVCEKEKDKSDSRSGGARAVPTMIYQFNQCMKLEFNCQRTASFKKLAVRTVFRHRQLLVFGWSCGNRIKRWRLVKFSRRLNPFANGLTACP